MKLQLLFTLFSALAPSSFANHEYAIYCSVATYPLLDKSTRVAAHCELEVEVNGESKTMDEHITLALEECVNDVTSEVVDIIGFYPATRRELRGVNMSPQQRLLGECEVCCCSREICQMLGYCGSSNSCGTQSCERRLEFLPEVSVTEEQELSAKCTEAMIALASMQGVEHNLCLGSDPSEIVCTVTETAHDQ
jgi:hypothetical protein